MLLQQKCRLFRIFILPVMDHLNVLPKRQHQPSIFEYVHHHIKIRRFLHTLQNPRLLAKDILINFTPDSNT